MRWLAPIVLVGSLVAACDTSFVFEVSFTRIPASADVLITIDGEPADLPRIERYESMDDAVARPLVIETWRDGQRLDRCELYATACRGRCQPTRETARLCVFEDGRIRLMWWDCACAGDVVDWFCNGACSATAP